MLKKILPLLLCVLLLSACASIDVPVPDTTAPTTLQTEETTEPTVETTAETKPLHSELYLPEYSVEQIIEYFNEVVLNVEYTDGTGDATLVQKWLFPIYYNVYGNPTDEDLAVLNDLFAQLNAVAGFPGIYPVSGMVQENLSISFFSPDVFRDEFSSVVNGEDAYGATQFWYYTDTNELYHGRIGHRTDIPQTERSSIIVEEIINTLGITDTVLREDSIVYQYTNENLTLSDVDWVILKLLYDPAIESGMDKDACEAVIRQLYY